MNEENPLISSDETSEVSLSIPNETLTVEAINDEKVLLANSDKTTVSEVVKEKQATAFSQYIDETSAQTAVSYQLNLNAHEQATLSDNKSEIIIWKADEIKAVLSAPMLESLEGNLMFIRNPKKNAGKAYSPAELSKADKIRLDSHPMGR
ncbi:MAG: hypothetical protein LBS33_03425 [Streptococcaceae bacterium]|nr:hypothetical protein [Streptococcaceae bacterium]